MGKKRGFALGFVLLTLFTLFVLGFSLSETNLSSLSQVLHSTQAIEALEAAQAGTAMALYGVKQNDPNLPTACGQTITPTSLQNISNPSVLPNSSKFLVSLTNNYGTACVTGQQAPDGTNVPPGMMYIQSKGIKGTTNVTRSSNTLLSVTRGWGYAYGAFGKIGFNYQSQGLADSFNSNNGAYGGSNILSHGNLGTNSTIAATAIVSSGGPMTVNGNVMVGTGGSYPLVTQGSSGYSVTGTMGSLATPIYLPTPIDPVMGSSNGAITCPPTCVLTPGKYGLITVNTGGVLTLGPGKYSVTGITVNTGSNIVITATTLSPVKVYTSGPVNMSGNITNTNTLATSFFLYGTNTTLNNWNWTVGSGNFYGAIYAPNTDWTIDFADGTSYNLLGSFVFDKFSFLGNINIHRDEALDTDPNAGTTQVQVKSWNQ